jgi:hypothetical protein
MNVHAVSHRDGVDCQWALTERGHAKILVFGLAKVPRRVGPLRLEVESVSAFPRGQTSTCDLAAISLLLRIGGYSAVTPNCGENEAASISPSSISRSC